MSCVCKSDLWNNSQIFVGQWHHVDGLVQERRNSSALAMELSLFCTNRSIWCHKSWSILVQVMAFCWTLPSHYLNQCLHLQWTFRNRLQWNLHPNTKLGSQDYAFENIICKMSAFLSRSQCVNQVWKLVVNKAEAQTNIGWPLNGLDISFIK